VRLLLDTGVLGCICHPRKHGDVRAWFRSALREHAFLISEVADYELRRELLRIGAALSVAHLDELVRELPYVQVSTATWRRAAALWASARNAGAVTAPPEALDGDVLIAAQAIEEDAAIVTMNTRHFAALAVPTYEWAAVPKGDGTE
jgi:predicted nucleic acid-binding protein